MGRHIGPACRLCRREGVKLMLKGMKCETAKCAIEKRERNKAPGMHGWRRGRRSDYAVRLRETQKVKRYYGVGAKQFLRYFEEAGRVQGNTGEMLLRLLERRLDNAIYKLNFAPSRKAARQIISHGHISINGRKTDICSFLLSVGDKITVKSTEGSLKKIKAQLESNPNFQTQGWLQLNADRAEATMVALPTREDVQIPIEENLVIEFCSR
jgi:small subunit ribosomal protein S4